MKILIVANYALSHQESMQRFAKMLEDGLLTEGHEVQVIRPEAILCKGSQAEHGLNKWLGYIDRFILFRWQLKQAARWADVVHICDHSNAMYAKWVNRPSLVTCHDLMAIQSALGLIKINKTGFTGRIFQQWIASGLQVCSHVACVSKNTQDELIKTLEVPVEKTSIAYNALNYPYSPMLQDQAWALIHKRLPDLKPPYFFHLGGNQWYKNRKGVVEIYYKLIQHPEYSDHRLVLAGKPWPDDLKDKISTLAIKNQVVEINDLTNEEIRAFYSVAEALIFPSLQEGFGWPIAEAQACGCKVITTGRAPMTEVGGDAAIYIEPERLDEAAEIIFSQLHAEDNLEYKSLENAKRFSMKFMIASYEAGYNQIYSIEDENIK
ncbi:MULTISPECIES: glycosyltransferase family 1 protein [unclassified Oceanobacter]|uniref:glycosyltransferase family 4 protein n=1 Tax=unclassified Oceanobacter TaxID=2620260 RepID=UPI0027354C18|nr:MULTISPECIES: glycosyltransferase family 1 protein [unclassified Oceanobacter]MDP2608080.1 glycosyltransferase family 1 protein [Oceanobacter sp. 1_MG-2023]MDP2611258.1 glycosyltransferase family 1 protein [Oceanobacter sp. 2_MG-2023]